MRKLALAPLIPVLLLFALPSSALIPIIPATIDCSSALTFKIGPEYTVSASLGSASVIGCDSATGSLELSVSGSFSVNLGAPVLDDPTFSTDNVQYFDQRAFAPIFGGVPGYSNYGVLFAVTDLTTGLGYDHGYIDIFSATPLSGTWSFSTKSMTFDPATSGTVFLTGDPNLTTLPVFNAVPEPSSLLLVIPGLAALAATRRRRAT